MSYLLLKAGASRRRPSLWLVITSPLPCSRVITRQSQAVNCAVALCFLLIQYLTRLTQRQSDLLLRSNSFSISSSPYRMTDRSHMSRSPLYPALLTCPIAQLSRFAIHRGLLSSARHASPLFGSALAHGASYAISFRNRSNDQHQPSYDNGTLRIDHHRTWPVTQSREHRATHWAFSNILLTPHIVICAHPCAPLRDQVRNQALHVILLASVYPVAHLFATLTSRHQCRTTRDMSETYLQYCKKPLGKQVC